MRRPHRKTESRLSIPFAPKPVRLMRQRRKMRILFSSRRALTSSPASALTSSASSSSFSKTSQLFPGPRRAGDFRYGVTAHAQGPAGGFGGTLRCGKLTARVRGCTPRREGNPMSHIRRREFITLVGGAAAWPLAARAQQAERMRRIGALIGFAETDSYGQASAHAFRQGLEQLGWVEGRNIRVDYRFAAGDPTLYKAYADELVGLRPDAILAGATPAVAVLQPMTRTIPIVFVLTADPVGQGFVQSLARPGGNTTGFGVYVAPMAKWLGLFKEIAPGLRHV